MVFCGNKTGLYPFQLYICLLHTPRLWFTATGLRAARARLFAGSGGACFCLMPFSAAPPSLLFVNSAGQLFADSNGFLRLELLPDTTVAAVGPLFEQALLLLKQTGWGRLLSSPWHFPPDTTQWLATNWLPRAAGQGAYRWCAVPLTGPADSPLPEVWVEMAHRRHRVGFQYFAGEARAVEWLLRQ
jgi:hypothetical protein